MDRKCYGYHEVTSILLCHRTIMNVILDYRIAEGGNFMVFGVTSENFTLEIFRLPYSQIHFRSVLQICEKFKGQPRKFISRNI